MKNRNGFTLIEIIVTIIIIAIIGSITFGVYFGLGSRNNERLYNAKVELIKTATEKWAEEANIRKPLTITVNRLVLDGYLDFDKDNGNVIDPRDKSIMNCLTIEISFENNNYIAEFIGQENCGLMDQEKEEDVSLEAYEITTNNKLIAKDNVLPWVKEDVRLESKYTGTGIIVKDGIKWYQNNTEIENNVLSEKEKFNVETKLSINTPFRVRYTIENIGIKSNQLQVRIDKVKPDIPILEGIDYKNTNSIWYKYDTLPNLTITAKDRESGVAKIEMLINSKSEIIYDKNKNEKDKNLTNALNTKKIFISKDTILKYLKNQTTQNNGSFTINFVVTDVAGNKNSLETNFKFNVDTVPPTCSSSGGNNNWVNTNITLYGTCSDSTPGSGCVQNQITKIYSGEINSTKETPGIVTDVAGNTTTCPANQTVKIDKTAPTCTTTGGSSNWINAQTYINMGYKVPITGVCNDNRSSINSGCTGNSLVNVNYETNSYINPGNVKDLAGNVTVCSNALVKLDVTSPTCQSSGGSDAVANYNGWANQDIAIYGTCIGDNLSGCGNNISRVLSTPLYTTAHYGFTNSPGTIYDQAGNATYCPANRLVAIDKQGPLVAITAYNSSGQYTSGQVSNSNVTIYPSATDSGSGVNRYQYSTDNYNFYNM